MADQQGTQQYDLVLKGGHVIDPANRANAKLDVAIADKKVAAVGANLPTAGAKKVVDVSGYYVTPGIIDIHVHCFPGHLGDKLSLPPEMNTFPSGVTTVADAGTPGWQGILDFKTNVVDKSRVRVFAFVNVAGRGMGEAEQDPRGFHPEMTAAAVAQFSEFVVGVKTAHYWTQKPWDDIHTPWAAVDAAVKAGTICNKPVMVDFWPRPERTYPEMILEKLRPGDIHTHVFAQQFPIVDDHGKLQSHMLKARERGVIFDLGHGGGSFWFRNAAPAIKQGFWPDSISTDLHIGSVNGPMFDMQTCMSKCLSMGMPLEEVFNRSTVTPAREINHPELGTLSVGAPADVAVFELKKGSTPFVDCGRAVFVGDQRLACVYTVRAGDTVFNPLGLGLPKWEDAPTEYWGTFGKWL